MYTNTFWTDWWYKFLFIPSFYILIVNNFVLYYFQPSLISVNITDNKQYLEVTH